MPWFWGCLMAWCSCRLLYSGSASCPHNSFEHTQEWIDDSTCQCLAELRNLPCRHLEYSPGVARLYALALSVWSSAVTSEPRWSTHPHSHLHVHLRTWMHYCCCASTLGCKSSSPSLIRCLKRTAGSLLARAEACCVFSSCHLWRLRGCDSSNSACHLIHSWSLRTLRPTWVEDVSLKSRLFFLVMSYQSLCSWVCRTLGRQA